MVAQRVRMGIGESRRHGFATAFKGVLESGVLSSLVQDPGFNRVQSGYKGGILLSRRVYEHVN